MYWAERRRSGSLLQSTAAGGYRIEYKVGRYFFLIGLRSLKMVLKSQFSTKKSSKLQVRIQPSRKTLYPPLSVGNRDGRLSPWTAPPRTGPAARRSYRPGWGVTAQPHRTYSPFAYTEFFISIATAEITYCKRDFPIGPCRSVGRPVCLPWLSKGRETSLPYTYPNTTD